MGWINAGFYVVHYSDLDDFSPGVLSLEIDIKPILIPSGVMLFVPMSL